MTIQAKIGLICPSYGYPGFLPELAASILSQKTAVPFCAVFVDDCCPDPETANLCNEYAFAYPEIFHYIRPRKNAGLSVTRNLGVDYLLTQFPKMEGLTFLDADDRIFPLFVERSYCALSDALEMHSDDNTQVGWVFEDPYMIGIPGIMRRLRKHSVLWNMVGATQTSSSIMSADMFRTGLRYAEDMKYGGEDWEFSLRAYKSGFRAYYKPTAGFRYRRRPGSMSASTAASLGMERNRADIRLRHPDLYQAKTVNALYAEECSHYCILEGGNNPRLASSIDDDGETIDFDRLLQILSDSCSIPANPAPQVFVFADPVFLDNLKAEKRLSDFAARLNHTANGLRITHHRALSFGEGGRASTVMQGFERAVPGQPVVGADIGAVTMTREAFLSLVNDARPSDPESCNQILDWRLASNKCFAQYVAPEIMRSAVLRGQKIWPDGIKPAHRNQEQVWKPGGMEWRDLPAMLTGIAQVLPEPDNLQRTLIITPGTAIVRRDCLDELLRLAEVVRDASKGRKPALAITGFGALPPGALDMFADVYLVPPKTETASSNYWGDERLVVSIASTFGCVVSADSLRLNNHTAILRKNGINLYHLLFHGSGDFEHGRVITSMFKAYTGFISDSGREKNWLVAHGVPAETIFPLKNLNEFLAV